MRMGKRSPSHYPNVYLINQDRFGPVLWYAGIGSGMIAQMQLGCGDSLVQHSDPKEVYYSSRIKMQVAVKKDQQRNEPKARNLTELKRGEHGIIERLDLPENESHRLLETGLLPAP